jgi:phospholipid transport system substrate-binding protein
MTNVSSRLRRLARFSLLLFAAVWTLEASAQNATTDPAVDRLRAFYDALLATMKRADQLGIEGRYAALAPVIRATYDLPAMTRIAVGPEWNSIPSQAQTDLIEQFTRMTIATYANRFDGYSGERFDVEPQSEARSTGRIVRTKLVPTSGDPVVLNYLMRGAGKDWTVVDVYLTGTISELAARRTEFAALLKSGGPNALIESLRQQADRLLHPPKPKAQ